MKDFRGVELAIGDTVAWTVGVSKMRLGKIDSFTPKCARVMLFFKDADAKPLSDKPYNVDPLRIAKINP